MPLAIDSTVKNNSYDYFEKALITDNGFREYDVRWLLGKEINANGFFLMGQAYGTYAQERLATNRVVVGHDFRKYSQDLCRSMILGLLATGMEVVDIGLALSPMLYFAQHHHKCRAGMQVTASHNENGWTGIKLAHNLSLTLGPDDIQELRQLVHGGLFKSGRGLYIQDFNLAHHYAQDLLQGPPLSRPVKVVVAAGNGTGGHFAPDVLRRLGCEVIPLDCSADWEFSKHNPNPEDMAFLHDLSKAVLDHGAEIGIGVDGDGDRIGVVDDQGNELFSDKLGLLLARWLCPQYPGRSVVIDVKSTGLFLKDPVLQAANAEILLCKTGHSYMKAKVNGSGALVGFEKSGHWFFNTPLGRGYDDCLVSSIYLLRMLDALSTPLSQLAQQLPKTWQSPTMAPYCADHQKYQVVEEMIRLFQQQKEQGVLIGGQAIDSLVTVNGVRFVFADGSWGLIRASSNKPTLVVVAEACASLNQLYDIIEHIQRVLHETGLVGEYDQQMPPRPVSL